MLLLPVVFFGIVAIVVVAKSVVVVPAGQVYVVSTLGSAKRVLNTGLHIVPPIVTTIAGKLSVSEQTLEVAETGARLIDGDSAAVKGTLRFRITEPLVAITDVADYKRALAEVTATHWRQAIEASDAANLRTALDAAIDPIRAAATTWGIAVVEVVPQIAFSEASVREIAEQAARERQTRVLEWLRERKEDPADNGRPSPEQVRAFDRWMQEAVEAHREEIEAARSAEQRARTSATPDPFNRTSAQGDAFAGAAPSAIAFAVARSLIPPEGTGRVEANGREWTARNESTVAIVAGFRCVVERQEGDTLVVRPM